MNETSAHRAAHEDLQYIRRTLAAAGHLSTVPGWGLVLIGASALGVVMLSALWPGSGSSLFDLDRQSLLAFADGPVHRATLHLWALLLVLSVAIGAVTMRDKAQRTGQVFWSPILRKALWGYGAAMALGGALTLAVLVAGANDLLPEIWLGCYGVALVSAGNYSVAPVRWMGLCFLALAAAAAVTPAKLGLALLGLGFGWVHIAFGAYIAWRHDG